MQVETSCLPNPWIASRDFGSRPRVRSFSKMVVGAKVTGRMLLPSVVVSELTLLRMHAELLSTPSSSACQGVGAKGCSCQRSFATSMGVQWCHLVVYLVPGTISCLQDEASSQHTDGARLLKWPEVKIFRNTLYLGNSALVDSICSNYWYLRTEYSRHWIIPHQIPMSVKHEITLYYLGTKFITPSLPMDRPTCVATQG